MTTDALLAPLMTLAIPDEGVLAASAKRSLDEARAIVIDCDAMYQTAAEELRSIKAAATKLEANRTEITGPLNAVVKTINARYKPASEFFAEAEKIVKGAMITWTEKVEAEAAAQRRAAEALVAAERQRLADQAEAARKLADEEQARLRKAAEEATAAGNAQAAAQANERAAMVEQSAAAEVAAIQMTAAVITAPVVQIAAKAAGTSVATSVDFEVFDLYALIRHVAAWPDLASLLKSDDVKVRAYVRGLGMNAKLPGVRVFEKKTLSSRAA